MKMQKTELDYLAEDIGLLLFLCCIFVVGIIFVQAEDVEKTESLIMFLILFVPMIFAVFGIRYLAAVLAGFMTLAYAVYRIYRYFAYTEYFGWISYAWLFIPLLAVGALCAFVQGKTGLELENRRLKEDMEELVMIDPVTGLYNLRSMYNDLERQMAFCARNQTTISLMVIQIKYGQEFRSVLSKKGYDRLRQRMADLIENSLRIEDRIYSIDEEGKTAVILTCDLEGAKIVKKRLTNRLGERDAFENILDKPLKMELKTGIVEYESETIKNAVEFLQRAESELQYDV